jgi:hypothetical protein
MSRFDIEPGDGPPEYVHDQEYPYDAELPPDYDEMSPEEEAYYASLAHDCPRDQFLDDPITEAYGVGSEMLHLIRCEICEAREHE